MLVRWFQKLELIIPTLMITTVVLDTIFSNAKMLGFVVKSKGKYENQLQRQF